MAGNSEVRRRLIAFQRGELSNLSHHPSPFRAVRRSWNAGVPAAAILRWLVASPEDRDRIAQRIGLPPASARRTLQLPELGLSRRACAEEMLVSETWVERNVPIRRNIFGMSRYYPALALDVPGSIEEMYATIRREKLRHARSGRPVLWLAFALGLLGALQSSEGKR